MRTTHLKKQPREEVQKNSQRFWEIDFLRGIAIIMMIVFHFLYDLNFFGIYPINVFKGFWGIFGKFTFILFLLLVGISLTLSASKRQKEGDFKFWRYLVRGIKIFLCGMIITLATYIVIPDAYVKFGILHLIGVSIIISFPFLRFKYLPIFTGIIVILIGLYFQTFTINISWLNWLGLIPHTFRSVDHFPIFPYWGIVLIGIFIGKLMYTNFVRNFALPRIGNYPIISQVCFLGKYSLLIYLIHQPLLIFLVNMV